MTERWRDHLWEAVENAVAERADPKKFLQEVRACWKEALRQEAFAADKALREGINA